MARQGTVTTALGHRLEAVSVTAIGPTASIGSDASIPCRDPTSPIMLD